MNDYCSEEFIFLTSQYAKIVKEYHVKLMELTDLRNYMTMIRDKIDSIEKEKDDD